MLFNQNQEASCSYCRYGSDLGRFEVACTKRGIMQSDGYCGSFRYEPTKRVPSAQPSLKTAELSGEDFEL